VHLPINPSFVVPAQSGTRQFKLFWMPAFAGMTLLQSFSEHDVCAAVTLLGSWRLHGRQSPARPTKALFKQHFLA
jgi:hypothetical protein